jgi:hypothetical protein
LAVGHGARLKPARPNFYASRQKLGRAMTEREALSELNQALAAIDLLLRNGRLDAGRLSELARAARRSAERMALAGPAAEAIEPYDRTGPNAAVAAAAGS